MTTTGKQIKKSTELKGQGAVSHYLTEKVARNIKEKRISEGGVVIQATTSSFRV